jgi:TrmH family RNA methyltransferase
MNLLEIRPLAHPSESALPVASRKNPLLRRIARLDQDAERRQEEGVYLLWGGKVVEEGLREPGRLERVLVGVGFSRQAAGRSLVRRLLRSSLPITMVEEKVLDDVLPGAGDQGLLALVRMNLMKVQEMLDRSREPVLLVADRIQDPGNLGTLVRLGEAAGIAGLLIMRGTVDPYHTRAARASAGSILRVPVARISGPRELAAGCGDRKMRILASVPEGGTSCEQADLRRAMVLVVGNEGEGVSREWLEAADLKLSIPLGGSVQSLNVTLATAMLLYEAMRQRRQVSLRA